MNIQDEIIKIHHQFGTTEKANYEIEKLFEKFQYEKINNLFSRNFQSAKRRNQITNKTYIADFFDKLDEEVRELKNSFTQFDAEFDEKELADVILVCASLSIFKGIDIIKVMENKVKFNENRND